ncbi:ankyrin repeat domain-containing protein [Sphingomonas cavernae]|uniref:Ankyrin repeat domain-containing protein n=1 Tax=Sphingomonas cavernae TaxID=2320861 RepID=A0A418WR56_9SPHN|nr:ankyrin repeat domain-containing protein [Sphingomonas cavernae]RJF93735.1 ankyrin repeat domain-containing protein [Sphingomonas cavernae]
MQFPKRAAAKTLLPALAAALMLPGIAHAQFSDSYSFLKAVRDANAAKAHEFLNEPGSTIVDTKDRATGETALHIVTQRRDLGWVALMLSKGAKTDVTDRQGNTPLMIAAQLGFVEGAQLLIGRRARVDAPNAQGETPLIRAVQNRDVRMTRLLLEAGANPDRTDTLAGMSARDYAKRDPRASVVLKLIEDRGKAKPTNVMGP